MNVPETWSLGFKVILDFIKSPRPVLYIQAMNGLPSILEKVSSFPAEKQKEIFDGLHSAIQDVLESPVSLQKVD